VQLLKPAMYHTRFGVKIMVMMRPCISGLEATAASVPTSSMNFCAAVAALYAFQTQPMHGAGQRRKKAECM